MGFQVKNNRSSKLTQDLPKRKNYDFFLFPRSSHSPNSFSTKISPTKELSLFRTCEGEILSEKQ